MQQQIEAIRRRLNRTDVEDWYLNGKPALFETGRVNVTDTLTRWAQRMLPDELLSFNRYVHILLRAHTAGCWDGMPEGDSDANELAIKLGGGRIFSSYDILDQRIYLITESDRSATTLMLAGDY